MNNLFNKKPTLQTRQEIIRTIRDYFYQINYLEVQVPLLIRGTNPDAFLTSFEVFENNDFRGYLTTSTEFQLLRLLSNGFRKVYTLTSNFRASDKDITHNPEFTMLEWEAANVNMKQIETETEELIKKTFSVLFPTAEYLEYNGQKVRFINQAWERLSVHKAFEKYLGLNLAPDFSLVSMQEEIKKVELEVPTNFLDDQGLVFSWLIDKISPNLGATVPTWLYDWPIFQTSMAEPIKENSAVAERSELYIAGLEIANGFTTVCDAAKQRKLFNEQQEERNLQNKKPVVVDEKYLADLEKGGLQAAGIALGVDRLVMILTGKKDINEVMAFGWDEI
ncbi:MAG: amino acid--tRNA ligase-related protein [Candidatus Uhrbacteria bacterium]